MPSHPENLKALSIDGLVSIIIFIIIESGHMNIMALFILWLILIATLVHFAHSLSFKGKAIRIALPVVVGCAMFFVAYNSIEGKISDDAIKEEEEAARIDIELAQFGDVGKTDAVFPFFNFYYANNGHLFAESVSHRFGFQTVSHTLAKSEIDDFFRVLESDPSQFLTLGDIPPGARGNYFSEPHEPGEEQERFENALPPVRSGQELLYLFEATRYRDKLTPNNKVRISEFCEYFGKELNVGHFCRQNIVHIQ